MKYKFVFASISLLLLMSCGGITKILKSPDNDYKYEVAKQYYMEGKYGNASLLLSDLIAGLKGTEKGDESLFLLGMCKYYTSDLISANEYLRKYYESYPTGSHVEEAHFFAGKSLYLSTPVPQLDQTQTYLAVTEFQNFIEAFPDSKYAGEARKLIFELQDKLVEKEYLSAKLYYNLGNYFGNCTMGGNNYEACILTAQNAIKDYPYSSKKENFAILILQAKYELATQSVKSKVKDRFNDAIDEYYGFINEYPNSKYTKQAKTIFDKAKEAIK